MSTFQYWCTLAGSQGTAHAFYICAIQGTTIELGDADGVAAVTDQWFGAKSKRAASSWLALMAAEVRRRARSMCAARAVRLGSQTIVLKR